MEIQYWRRRIQMIGYLASNPGRSSGFTECRGAAYHPGVVVSSLGCLIGVGVSSTAPERFDGFCGIFDTSNPLLYCRWWAFRCSKNTVPAKEIEASVLSLAFKPAPHVDDSAHFVQRSVSVWTLLASLMKRHPRIRELSSLIRRLVEAWLTSKEARIHATECCGKLQSW